MKKDKYIEYILWILAIILLFPALFVNLGLMPLNFPSDEPTRAIVALEMMISGDYIHPTINGELYYNKPPLFNWIIIFFNKITGNLSELTLRLPVTFSLLFYGLFIFLFTRKYYGNKTALLHALVFISCGRILFWDSFIGLIDISFSMIIFMLFMSVFYFFRKEKYNSLFLVSYFLAAIAFLFKGLPAIVFLGITLVVYLIYEKRIKLLFSIHHFYGILIFILITGTYYFFYSQQNSLEEAFITLFTESSKRTVIRFGLFRTIIHFLKFPFEMIYHFAPWSLLAMFFFRRSVIRDIKSDPLIKYCLIILFFNILPYWTSPEVHPRYLLMLAPLIFIPMLQLYLKEKREESIKIKVFEYILAFPAIFIPVFLVIFPFTVYAENENISYPLLKSILLFIVTLFLSYSYLIKKQHRLIAIIAIIFVIRIWFNWFIFPQRYDYMDHYRSEAIRIAQKTKGKPLYIFEGSTDQQASSFYIERERWKILQRSYDSIDQNAYYIANKHLIEEMAYDSIDQFYLQWENKRLLIVKFKDIKKRPTGHHKRLRKPM